MRRVRYEGNSKYFTSERLPTCWFANRIWNEMFRLWRSHRMASWYLRFMPKAHRLVLYLGKPIYTLTATEIRRKSGRYWDHPHLFAESLSVMNLSFQTGEKKGVPPYLFTAVHISAWLPSILCDKVKSYMTCGSSVLDRTAKHKDCS